MIKAKFFSKRKERLVLTLLVKNEVDIILDNILYHYARGVDKVVVCDNGSTDGTFELLQDIEKLGLIHLIKEDLYNQDKIVNRMGAIAQDKYSASILIHADADEFWTPLAMSSLKRAFLALKEPAVLIDRKDALPVPRERDNAFPQKHMNIVTTHLTSEDIKSDSKKTSLFLYRLPPKVMFSIKEGLKNVTMGNHLLADEGSGEVTDKIVIYHFPFKSSQRFEEKVRIAGEAMEKVKTPPDTWWHWKRWDKAYRSGKLSEEVDILVPNLSTIRGLEYEPFSYDEKILAVIKSKKKLWKYRNHIMGHQKNKQV